MNPLSSGTLTSQPNPLPPASDSQADPLSGPQEAGLHSNGPYNPAALLPPHLVKRILNLEFVEIADISPNEAPAASPGHPPPLPKKPIQDISLWAEKFSTMAAILASRFPEKAPELFMYMAAIVRAERNYGGNRWVLYDRCYRREALANKSLDWSQMNSRLYSEAFTGYAKAIPRCTHCLQDDHVSAACPQNPTRGWFPWLPESSAPPPGPTQHQQQERCNRFNDGRCRNTANSCKFLHKCKECWGPHPIISCPRNSQGRTRSRSPIQRRPAGGHGRSQ